MTFAYVKSTVIPAALSLLPAKLDTKEARALLLAISLQEARCFYRRQVGGPALSLWQFEHIGVKEVLQNRASAAMADAVLAAMSYNDRTSANVHAAMEQNDVLACAIARLLLWRLPQPLPGPDQPEEGWRQYISAWRPGKPHPEIWPAFYKQAWQQ